MAKKLFLFPLLRPGFLCQGLLKRPAFQTQKRSAFCVLEVAGFVSVPFRHVGSLLNVFLLIIRSFRRTTMCRHLLKGTTIFQSSLKGSWRRLPIVPIVETVGYFHSSGWRRTGAISGNQFKSAFISVKFFSCSSAALLWPLYYYQPAVFPAFPCVPSCSRASPRAQRKGG